MLKPVQFLGSYGMQTCGYETWFYALDAMCKKIDKIDFDIALIGAGGYGIFLAQYIKSIRKKAMHS